MNVTIEEDGGASSALNVDATELRERERCKV